MRGLPSILSLFRKLNKFDNTGARMLDSIDHTTLKLLSNHNFRHEKLRFCYLLRNHIMDVINYITLLVMFTRLVHKLRQVCVKFKDLSRTSKSIFCCFIGLKICEKYCLTRKNYTLQLLKPRYIRMRIWASKRENLSSRFGDNKGADQPVHLRRLISTFVIIILERIVSKLSKFEF